MCGLLLVGVAHALERSVMHVQQSVRSVRRKAKRTHYVKRVRECERVFKMHNVKIWSFLKTTTCFICFPRCCCSLSYSLFSMRTSRRCGCIYTLSSLPFCARHLALSCSDDSFCHFDVATMRPLMLLQH